MKKRRSRKENEYDLKKAVDTPRENLHETVEIIEESIEELENPNDDEQIKRESADNYGIEFDEKGMCAKPTPEFWEAWQEDKEEIKGRGWWVVKDRNPFSPLSGEWVIFKTEKHLRSYNYRQERQQDRKKRQAKLGIRRSYYILYYDMIGGSDEDEDMWQELRQVLKAYHEKGIILNYMYEFAEADDVTDKYK